MIEIAQDVLVPDSVELEGSPNIPEGTTEGTSDGMREGNDDGMLDGNVDPGAAITVTGDDVTPSFETVSVGASVIGG